MRACYSTQLSVLEMAQENRCFRVCHGFLTISLGSNVGVMDVLQIEAHLSGTLR